MEPKEKAKSYQTISVGGSGEVIEKKSRFVAVVSPAGTESDALVFIEKIKKQNWDASHNCFAYVVGEDAQTVRCSDDGEPTGTAGRPMLDVLMKEGIRNAVIVVTRYFGGTLLGTGGLVRAYTQAAKEGLKASTVVWMRYGIKIALTANYNDAGRVQYILEKKGFAEYGSEYTELVEFTVVLPIERMAGLQKDIIEATNARVKLKELGHLFYVDKQKGV